MNPVARTATRLWRLPVADTLFVAGVLGLLLTLEVLGRFTSNDLHDLIALFTLGGLLCAIVLRQRQRPLPIIARCYEWLAQLRDGSKTWAFEIGIDLRGTPRVKRGTPPAVLALGGSLVGLFLLFALVAPQLPNGMRAVSTHIFYLGYLAGLALLWTLLILAALLAVFLPTAMIHDACIARHTGPGRRSRRVEGVLIFGYLLTLMMARELLPPIIAPLVCLAVLSTHLTLAALLGPADIAFLWRPRGSVQVRSMAWGRWVACEFGIIGLALIDLALAAAGGRITGRTAAFDEMPITSFLGLTVAWLAPGVMLALFGQMLHGRWRDPARRCLPVLRVLGDLPANARRAVRDRFAARGFRVRFGGPPAPLDVAVQIVDRAPPTDDPEPHWPLPVQSADLGKASIADRIERRDAVQKRRKFLGGLETLFKQAAGRRGRAGSGVWVVPHFWFVLALMRDTPRDADEPFDFADDPILSGAQGTPFHRAWPRAVRHHLHQILRGVQIDLVFVEDGVTFRQQRRVWRAVFEVFDVGGGRRRVEEVDFRGMPGTRVVIHEFQFDDPYESRTYPEPQYDFLGRARILHIFKDRTAEEEDAEMPFDRDRSPAPSMAGW